MTRGARWLLVTLAAIGLAAGASSAPADAAPKVWAHASKAFVPNDPGLSRRARGWVKAQWNFAGPFGVGAPQAWGHLITAGAPGARGVTIAVLDTGIASTDQPPWRRSPDLRATRFVPGRDFVDGGPSVGDPSGHGTHVASTIAESTNNGYGMTGLAYGARIMPVRVLNAAGDGDSVRIARGVRFAVAHGAQVINMSLNFDPDVRAAQIPELLAALREADDRGAVVIASAGNDSAQAVSLPARAASVVAVGATTEHGCLARFSNVGAALDLVAPGGGEDADLVGDVGCRPDAAPGRDVLQVTLLGAKHGGGRATASPSAFGVGAFAGTSMAAPHVAASAALVIASNVIGPRPTAAAITARLQATARDLGPPGHDTRYGSGLLDAAAATLRSAP